MAAVVAELPWAKRTRRALRARAVLLALAFWGLLPHPLALACGRLLGNVAFLLAGRERRRALAHLALAFPEKTEAERRRLARRTFRHLGLNLAELARERYVDAHLDALVELPEEDRRQLTQALARGKGAIIVTAHLGNWELLARRVAALGVPVSVVAREMNAPALTRATDDFRARGGVKTIWRTNAGAARQMLRVFKENGLLGLLIDQDTRVQSVFVPFFGRLAATPRAAGDLAARSDTPLLTAFIFRRPGGRHLVRIRPVDLPLTGARDHDGLALTAAATLAIERAIREAPDQWVWMHERWKTRPPAKGDERPPGG